MSAGKQPQDPGPSAKELQKNKEASTKCPICTNDLLRGLVVKECGHVFCSECNNTLTEISRANGVSRPPCPVCRRKFPNTIPGHAYTNMLEVVAQQDVTLTAVQAEAAKKLAAVQADAAKQLDAVKEQLGAVMQTLGGVTHKLATVEAKVLNDEKSAVAKVETEKKRLAERNEKQERAASNKAAGSKRQDEVEKKMMKEDKERYAASKAKKLKREEDKDKDWNPKRRK